MLSLEIITPKQVMLSAKVSQVTLPGQAGEMGVFAGHLQLLTSLKSGVLRYRSEGKNYLMAVHYGFAQVNKDQVTVLANQAETVEEIDLDTAVAEVESLMTQLKDAQNLSDDAAQLTKALNEAETRLAVAQENLAK